MPLFSTPQRAGLLLAAGLLTFSSATLAQAPTKQWDKRFGGTGVEMLNQLLLTPDGGYLLAGRSASVASGDKSQTVQGGDDFWVVRLDAQGNKLWDRSYGGIGNDQLLAAVATPDGGFLLGGETASPAGGDKTQPLNGFSDMWLVKIDAQGNKLWDRSYGGSGGETLYALLPTADGGYLLGGSSGSGISGDKSQPSQGGSDYWVIKLDAAGGKQWDRTFGTNNTDNLTCLLPTPDGGYLLGGHSWAGISGDRTTPALGGFDYWVVKLDASGTKQWDKAYGGSGFDYLWRLQATPAGGYLLAGSSDSDPSTSKTQASKGNTDYWLVQIDAQGNRLWDKVYGGSDYDALRDLQPTADGGYLLMGESVSSASGDRTQTSRGNMDYWAVKIDAQGSIGWDRGFGGSDPEAGMAARQLPDGSFALAGYSSSGVSGDRTQASQGNSDYWLLKTTAAGALATTAPQTRPALTVYPNPARAHLTLQLPPDAPRTGLRLTLLDATGRTVLRQPVQAAAGLVPLAVAAPPRGLYLLLLEGDGGYRRGQRLQLE